MERLLIVGVNTRPVAEAAYKLGFEVYSVSYYCPRDFYSYHERRCILEQKPLKSSGRFHEEFKPSYLKILAEDFLDEVDKIIVLSGGSPEDFPSQKILGNKKTRKIEDKYSLYKRLRGKFKVPETYKLDDIKEACEIQEQEPGKRFLIKPLIGSGGFGVSPISDYRGKLEGPFILQEFIEGLHLSASVLSTGKDVMTILTSRQLIDTNIRGWEDNLIYSGNIVPAPYPEIKKVGEDVIRGLSLLGSNGVDMVLSSNGLYVIEVNPRIQGTFECAQLSLGINMLSAHIKACEGELVKEPSRKKYTVKRIVYAPYRCQVGDLNLPRVYDIPCSGSIIEAGEPVVTLLDSHENLNTVLGNIKGSFEDVMGRLKIVD
ncbi:ATP-grasp domain-containing protein [Methanothermobacter tenebrarum]|uniref:ATP-dependent carboligase n=1 Tax=Methanothermobacter tenebrarum TaxID=680118 RepID=A0A328PIU6_9EURY|nr:ATP-grasp domain-containing protein [Methanothermobacter tenebrarum]NPV64981.1 ATP-grasp domain-containing protein [Methanobacteriaceae archaeon]RAO79334.1 ATP-dependent carboligase [Methanothermobacter tenebrarum]